MRFFIFVILLGQLANAADLRILLSKNEVQNLNVLHSSGDLHEKFSSLFKAFKLDLSCTSKAGSELHISGAAEQLKIAEFLYFFWLKDLSKAELKFSHFEGGIFKRQVMRQFSKELDLYKANKFQFSNKLLKDIGNDINGFSFYVLPDKDLFQEKCQLTVRLSYKNEDLKIGDKGTQLLDLNTTFSMKSGKEYIIKVSDEQGAGWRKNSYLSFVLNHSLNGQYFKEHLPRELSTGPGILKVLPLSSGVMDLMGEKPKVYFEKLGVKFPDWGFVQINKRRNELLIYNTKENLELLKEVLHFIPNSEKPNVTTNISIFESNLIISDTDKLEGHSLKKLASFTTLCSQGSDFLISRSFNGDYESALLMNIKMPAADNKFKYELTLKTPGPKSKARNYKLEGNFAGTKKYRVHLDDYHFMEVQVLK